MILPYQHYRDVVSGQAPIPTTYSAGSVPGAPTGGGGGAATTPVGGPESPQAASGAQGGTQTPTETSGLPYGGTGSLADRLLGGVETRLGQNQSQAAGLGQDFYGAAGPARTYETSGAQGTLDQAIGPNSQEADRQKARDLVTSTYSGPQGYDQEKSAQLANAYGELSAQAQALRGGRGAQAGIQQAIPGVTSGEAALEAARLTSDPQYNKRAITEANQASAEALKLEQDRAAAEKFAQERTAQERAIADQSRKYVTDKRTSVLGDIDALAAERNAANQKTQADYSALMQNDTYASLPEQYQSMFNSESRQRDTAADQAYQSIIDKYKDLQGLGTLTPIITERGKTWYGLADAEGNVTDIRDNKDLDRATQKRLVERQRELESLFGPTHTSQSWGPGTGKVRDVVPDYRSYKPLYGENQGFTAQDDLREYFSLDEGTQADRANTATDQQRAMVDNIDSILQDIQSLSDMGQEYRAAAIAANVEKYLENESAKLDAIPRELNQQEKDWKKKVKKARDRYKKKKAVEGWGKAAGIIGNVAMGGIPATIGQNQGLEHMGTTGAGTVIH